MKREAPATRWTAVPVTSSTSPQRWAGTAPARLPAAGSVQRSGGGPNRFLVTNARPTMTTSWLPQPPLRPLAPGRQRIAQLLTAASPGTVGAVYDPGADDVVQAALAMGAPVAPVLLGPSSLLASRTVWRWTRTS